MKKTLTVLKYLLFLFIGVGLLWLTFRHQSPFEIIERIGHADLKWIGVSLLLSILALISRSYRWNLLIHPLGYRPKLMNTFHSLMIGYFANLAIPRIGEISRCAALNKAEHVPFDKLIGTVIVERVSDVVMLIISIILVLAIEYERLGGFLYQHLFAPAIASFKNSEIIIIITIFILIAACFFIYSYFKNHKGSNLSKKIKSLTAGIIAGLKSIVKMRSRGAFVFHSFFIWIMYFLMTYTCFHALKSTEALDAKAGLLIMVIGGIAMSAPVQGGIGTYHFLVSQALLLYGIDNSSGIVFATMVHTWQMIICIVFGLIGWLAIFVFSKNKVNGASQKN